MNLGGQKKKKKKTDANLMRLLLFCWPGFLAGSFSHYTARDAILSFFNKFFIPFLILRPLLRFLLSRRRFNRLGTRHATQFLAVKAVVHQTIVQTISVCLHFFMKQNSLPEKGEIIGTGRTYMNLNFAGRFPAEIV